MNPRLKVRKLFEALQDEWGLGLWKLVFDKGCRVRLGQCRRRPREIGLTDWYVDTADWEKVEDTLRHEVAHALCFEVDGKGGHGPVWQEWARTVGADPTTCKEVAEHERPEHAKPKWRIYCPSGCWSVPRHRVRRSLIGRLCKCGAPCEAERVR